MGSYLETVRGAIPPWECDVVEHFTIACYFDKLGMSTARLLAALGHAPGDPAAPRVTDCYARFSRELRVADVYTVEAGVIAAAGAEPVLGHRFVNAETGAVCATVEQTLCSAVPLERAAAHQVEWDGPARQAPAQIPADQSWYPTVADVVQPHELDWCGNLSLAGHVHRFSAGNGHIMNRAGMTRSYLDANRIGFSTFELQLRLHPATPRSGTVLDVQGTVAKIGRSSLGFAQRMSDPRDGRLFAELRQLGVHFDKDARRPAAMPEALLAGMRRLQTRGE